MNQYNKQYREVEGAAAKRQRRLDFLTIYLPIGVVVVVSAVYFHEVLHSVVGWLLQAGGG